MMQQHSCTDVFINRHLKQWAMKFGIFIDLDAYYMAITFLNPSKDVDGCHLVMDKSKILWICWKDPHVTHLELV